MRDTSLTPPLTCGRSSSSRRLGSRELFASRRRTRSAKACKVASDTLATVSLLVQTGSSWVGMRRPAVCPSQSLVSGTRDIASVFESQLRLSLEREAAFLDNPNDLEKAVSRNFGNPSSRETFESFFFFLNSTSLHVERARTRLGAPVLVRFHRCRLPHFLCQVKLSIPPNAAQDQRSLLGEVSCRWRKGITFQRFPSLFHKLPGAHQNQLCHHTSGNPMSFNPLTSKGTSL